MKSATWKKRIKADCMAAGTYADWADPVIETLANILEKRDAAQEQYEKMGGGPIVKHTNKAGATNLVKHPALMAVNDLKRIFRAKVYAGANETELLGSATVNLSWQSLGQSFSVSVDETLREGQEFELLGVKWTALETPGHTAGSMCYYIGEEGILLSGDTLFCESYGRTDLPTGSQAQIADSIRGKLFALPEDTMVYPGHGDPTTIGHEKMYNPMA